MKKDVENLQEDFAKLRREFQSLELEWTNAYEKLRQMMGRVAKRAELLRRETDAEDGGTTTDGQSDARASGLTARQLELNQRILARRNRLAPQRMNGGE